MAASETGLTTLTVDDCDLEAFTALAADFSSDSYGYVVTPNADQLIRYHEDYEFRHFYEHASYVLWDSRFLASWLAVTQRRRLPVCPGSDLTAELFAKVIGPADRIVLVGGSAAQAAELRVRFGLSHLHHIDPPMGFIVDNALVERCLQAIEAASPFRFCLLAVGSPQQEILAWHLARRGKARGLALCVGASINFLTARERRAPVWMRRIGLEWLFRLAQNPRRLGKRYLLRGPRVFPILQRVDIRLREPANATRDRRFA